MIIIKNPLNSKRPTTVLVQNSSDFSNAFDFQLLAALIRRLKQNLNSNFRSHRGTLAAQDQRAVQCHIRGEASLRVLCAIVPMKDDRQMESIPYCRSALQSLFQNWPGPHMPSL